MSSLNDGIVDETGDHLGRKELLETVAIETVALGMGG